MTHSKIYLNVPFAQKDTAKALGARWDATLKKWYAPADKNIALFAQWHTAPDSVKTITAATSKPKSSSAPTAKSDLFSKNVTGVMTYAADKNFVAYNGEEPPWH